MFFWFFSSKNFKIYIQQRYATNGYCEVLNVKLNIWFDIPSKYIEDFCVIVSVAESIFSERLTATSSQYFSLWFFAISLIMIKTDVKNVFWRVFFSRTGLPFFFFFWICVIYLLCTCYSWVLFLKQKVVHCVLSFWLVYVMRRSYMVMLL